MSEQRSPMVLYLLTGLLALAAYGYGLDSRYIPKNGDEAVYMHITRVTAQGDQLLPLASELDKMRNTKPPLLFWQGLAATGWGQHWDQWRMRVPSVLYTFGTALLCYLLAWRLTGSDTARQPARQTAGQPSGQPAGTAARHTAGLIAALVWLSFFSTFRYGRPYLTNPPEIFWLFLPFFALSFWGARLFESRWLAPLAFGAAIGLGLLYKSFALLLPVGFGLTLWYWHYRQFRIGLFVRHDAAKLAIMSLLALTMFALWFVFDTDPAAVWQEFVIGENAQKFDAERGYLRTLLWGASSLWSMLLQYPLNAALLAAPMVMLFVVAWRHRAQADADQQRLWLWIAALFLVFVLPSQRSGRYLMPAMPALAVLLAVHWHRIGRFAFVLTLILCGAVAAMLGLLSLQLHRAIAPQALYPFGHWLLFAALLALVLVAMRKRDWLRPASLAAIFLVYLIFASTVRPLDGELGRYSAQAQAAARGKDVWVPCHFRAAYESHRFLLPGANVLGYRDSGEPRPAQLAQRFALFAVRVPIQSAGCEGCKVLGQRLEIQSRHSAAQINQMLAGKLFENLFVRELLVESPALAAADSARSAGTRSECR